MRVRFCHVVPAATSSYGYQPTVASRSQLNLLLLPNVPLWVVHPGLTALIYRRELWALRAPLLELYVGYTAQLVLRPCKGSGRRLAIRFWKPLLSEAHNKDDAK